MPTHARTASVIGAGPVGALAAIYLARLGYAVRVYERRSDPRAKGYIGGRSINLALSARGLWGLAGVGLDRGVLDRAIPMRGRMIHAERTASPLVFQPYSTNPHDAINSISRSGLNLAILESCGHQPGIELHFDSRCVDVDLDTNSVQFVNDATGETFQVQSDLILGSDGAFSPVRLRLQKTDRFNYSQSYLEHGYKELHIPAKDGGYAMDPGALHIWPRSSAMMIALPNPDKSFTCTLFWPFEGEHGLESLTTRQQVREFFERHYPDAPALMPTLEEDYLRNPSSSLVTVRCSPWTHVNRDGRCVALIGDAAHAIVPFFGQGMNCGFEDCRVLAECMKHSGSDLGAALKNYHDLRKPNADAIAQMALDNFVEMRDKVGSSAFLRRKKIEHLLHEWYPSRCVPKYNLVSFSTVPYVEAMRQGQWLDGVLDELARVEHTGDDREWESRLEREAERVLNAAGARL